ncbi:oxidoreductase [Halobium salinum]|uniref:Oxidoreductase n=1 Tax=Halobium salinum TaxID=1364940 RepID=A0ABD5PC94_9EURY|nr:oxidoreductase [Halobium salinum]
MSHDWTPDRMSDLTDRTVVVTGANSGIGREAVREFARAGARVVLACRDTEKGAAAARDIRRDAPDADLDVRELDLADLDSVAAFAADFEAEYDDLHVLVNNAGVMAIPRSETADGFETQFGVNHLGHFALTGHLLDRVVDTAERDGEARVVTVSSGVHERGEMNFDDLHGERDYGRWEAYAQSKLANLLFAYELDRRLRAAGHDRVKSVGCHPGWAATNLQRRGPELAGSKLGERLTEVGNRLFAQSAAQGAWPTLYAATSPDVRGGDYVGPSGFMNMRGPPAGQRSSVASYDRDDARRLWAYSEEATGVTYDLPAVEARTAD